MGQLLGLQEFKDTVQLKTMNRELAAAQRRDDKAQREVGVESSILCSLCWQPQSRSCSERVLTFHETMDE
jgi:hypothetical protein